MSLCFAVVCTFSWTYHCFSDVIFHSLEINENGTNTAKGEVRATEMYINAKHEETQEAHSNTFLRISLMVNPSLLQSKWLLC